MTLHIRPATAADEQDVTTLWRACGLVVSYNDAAADFHFALGKPGSDVLVGEDAAGAIKAAMMLGHDGHRGWIYYLAAAPDARGLGYGRQMVQAAEAWMRARSVPKLQLMVRDTNTAIVPFYEALGFEVSPRVVLGKFL